ncbi:MAG TPA: hypothetical protein VH370_00940 [Humisphaera sp.]|jgi:hypothetical protein|nr:hypothetical protein [Humisphaera sp.]
MRSFLNWTLLGTLGVGLAPALVVAAPPEHQLDRDKTPVAQAPTLPPGFTAKDVKADNEIRSGLAKLTDRALTKGDFNSMLAELATQDKDRAREFKGVDQKRLDGRIDQIRKAFKDKYGKDFSLSDTKTVYAPYIVIQGEVADPAVALAHWPVSPIAGQAVEAGSRERVGNDNKTVKKEAKAEELTKGRDVAIIHIPAASHNMGAMNVSMLHEAPMFYRVDIPNDRTGEQIYNDLFAHLTYVGDRASEWPTNIDEAYRMFTHHVVAAMYGLPVPGRNG